MGRAKVEEEGVQRLIGGTKPNNRSRVRRKMEAAKALVSQPLAASGAFCHEGSRAGEVGELGGGKMVVGEVAPQG